jgi:regulator of nucleoside diphosphate kinase
VEKNAGMKEKVIIITTSDLEKLRNLIAGIREGSADAKTNLNSLEKELDKAMVVDLESIPEDVVTVGSAVRIRDLASEEEMTYEIVFPIHADIAENRISILAPVGTALLGYRVGDVVEWTVPFGTRRFKILGVKYQPQAAKIS